MKLRKQQSYFNKITAGDFKNAGIVVSDELINELLSTFTEERSAPINPDITNPAE